MRTLRFVAPRATSTSDELRDYQREDADRLLAAFWSHRRVLYTLPTGGGKTCVAVAVVRAVQEGGVLVLAHRRELIDQAATRLIRAGVDASEIDVIMAGDRRSAPGASIHVASIDTLRHRALPAARFIVVDEAHRAVAKTYRELLSMYPDARVLGMTATPYRLDGRGMSESFDELVVGRSMSRLIEDGWLAKPRAFTVPDSMLPDLQNVREVAGDYDRADLATAVNRATLVGNIVEHWFRLAEGRRTVVFAVDRLHAQTIDHEFRRNGVRSAYLDGTTTRTERASMLEALRTGRLQVVCNCEVLTEGWDAPEVKCAVLARPTMSKGLCMQMAGRLLRPWRGVRPLVLDHAGNLRYHGLPQDDRTFTLQGKKRKRGEALAVVTKRCPECGAVNSLSVRTCSECGHRFYLEGVPQEVPGVLVEVTGPRACSDCGKPIGCQGKTGRCRSCASIAANTKRTPEQQRERLDRIRASRRSRRPP